MKPLGTTSPVTLPDIDGVRIACLRSETHYRARDDMAVFLLPETTQGAAIFTRNTCAAATVKIAREHLVAHHRGGKLCFILVHAGCANAATGQRGIDDMRTLCGTLAQSSGLSASSVWPISTGVIGEYLPYAALEETLQAFKDHSKKDSWMAAAAAMMTTDKHPKGATCTFQTVAGASVTINGIIKGSGMVEPDMATLIAILGSDAAMPQLLLQRGLESACNTSLNRISVDGDTSTNDTAVLFATAKGAMINTVDGEDFARFRAALKTVMNDLAEQTVRDGEGVSRIMEVTVQGAQNDAEALRTARCVGNSSLVKTALHGGDANWGRIVMAIGNTQLDDFAEDRLAITIGDTMVMQHGTRHPHYQEAMGTRAMRAAKVPVMIDLGRGNGRATILTGDLSAEYVRINADYRS